MTSCATDSFDAVVLSMRWPVSRLLAPLVLAFSACTIPPVAAPFAAMDASTVIDSDAGETPDAAVIEPDGGEMTLDAGTEPEIDAGIETPDAGTETPDAGVVIDPDLDEDGLSDEWEAIMAATYLPYLSLDEKDGCSRGGIVYRVRMHPKNGSLLAITYDHLYETDCGLDGHTGDNEAFGITVDPKKPAPEGITAIVAISHQNTLCQRVTKCGVCGGLDGCETGNVNGRLVPVVYSSKDKHGSYVKLNGSLNSCNLGSCFDQCTLAPAPASVPMVNAGEPRAHLVDDLTDQGFITSANGWTKSELLHFPLWDSNKEFGTAGNVADDLQDSAFEAEPCVAP